VKIGIVKLKLKIFGKRGRAGRDDVCYLRNPVLPMKEEGKGDHSFTFALSV